MKIFLIGLSKSGRTTVAKALAEKQGNYYVSAMDWLFSTFRVKTSSEDDLDYERNFTDYLIERIRANPYLISDNILEVIRTAPKNTNFIIDGLSNPQNFIKLFDYNQDLVVVLNRLDSENDSTDQDNIALNVIRDYLYWLSSMNLFPKDRWIEYNFRMLSESSANVKKLGSRNIVYIAKSLKDVVIHLKETLSLLP